MENIKKLKNYEVNGYLGEVFSFIRSLILPQKHLQSEFKFFPKLLDCFS